MNEVGMYRGLVCLVMAVVLTACETPKNETQCYGLNDSLAIPQSQIADVKRRAVSGDGASSYRLADHYLFYVNNTEEGNYWLKKSAEQGNANGQQAWGTILISSENADDPNYKRDYALDK